MTPREVENLLGPPIDENQYITGKAFIPFYFGRDRWRRAYFYRGLGRVVFAGGGGFSMNATSRGSNTTRTSRGAPGRSSAVVKRKVMLKAKPARNVVRNTSPPGAQGDGVTVPKQQAALVVLRTARNAEDAKSP